MRAAGNERAAGADCMSSGAGVKSPGLQLWPGWGSSCCAEDGRTGRHQSLYPFACARRTVAGCQQAVAAEICAGVRACV